MFPAIARQPLRQRWIEMRIVQCEVINSERPKDKREKGSQHHGERIRKSHQWIPFVLHHMVRIHMHRLSKIASILGNIPVSIRVSRVCGCYLQLRVVPVTEAVIRVWFVVLPAQTILLCCSFMLRFCGRERTGLPVLVPSRI